MSVFDMSVQVKDDQLELVIVQGHVELARCDIAAKGPVTPGTLNGPGPACRYVNIELVGSTAEQGVVGTVLLENPRGKYIITHKELVSQVIVYYKIRNKQVFLKFEMQFLLIV